MYLFVIVPLCNKIKIPPLIDYSHDIPDKQMFYIRYCWKLFVCLSELVCLIVSKNTVTKKVMNRLRYVDSNPRNSLLRFDDILSSGTILNFDYSKKQTLSTFLDCLFIFTGAHP